jgi:hypothetical protein
MKFSEEWIYLEIMDELNEEISFLESHLVPSPLMQIDTGEYQKLKSLESFLLSTKLPSSDTRFLAKKIQLINSKRSKLGYKAILREIEGKQMQFFLFSTKETSSFQLEPSQKIFAFKDVFQDPVPFFPITLQIPLRPLHKSQNSEYSFIIRPPLHFSLKEHINPLYSFNFTLGLKFMFHMPEFLFRLEN